MNEEVIIRMGMDTNGIDQGIRSTTHKIKEFASEVGSHLGKMFAAGAMIAGIEKVFGYVHDLRIESENLGASFESLQGFKVAADHIGPGAEKSVKGLSVLNQTLGEAMTGSEEARAKFEHLGISLKDLAGKDAMEALMTVADVIQKLPDPAQRSAAAFSLMGKSGREMAGMLSHGSGNLRELIDEAAKISEKDAERIEDAHRRIKDLGNSLTVFLGKVIAAVPSFAQALGTLSVSGGLSANARAAQHEHIEAIGRKARAIAEAQDQIEKDDEARKVRKDAAEDKQLAPIAKSQRQADAELELRKQGWEPSDRKFMEGVIKADKSEIAEMKQQLAKGEMDAVERARLRLDLTKAENKLLDDQDALQKKITAQNDEQLTLAKEHKKHVADLTALLSGQVQNLHAGQRAPAAVTIEELTQSPFYGRAANQVVNLRGWAHQNAIMGNIKLAEAQATESDRIFAAIAKQNPFLNDPMHELRENTKRTAEELRAITGGAPITVQGVDD